MIDERTIGEILGEALRFVPTPEHDGWEAIRAVGDMIAAHYWLDREAVWDALLDAEGEVFDATGNERLGRVLERPEGVAILARHIADNLAGTEFTDTFPLLLLSYH